MRVGVTNNLSYSSEAVLLVLKCVYFMYVRVFLSYMLCTGAENQTAKAGSSSSPPQIGFVCGALGVLELTVD